MKFGLSFVNTGHLVAREPAAALARLAEELGFSTLWAGDHIVVPVQHSSTYPVPDSSQVPFDHETPFAAPGAFLGYMAGVTEKIRLGTGVLVLAERNPLEVAKTFATVDQLSNGRTVMGIGIGWLREEFEALGISFQDRLERTTEGIEILKRLWAEPAASFAGAHFNFPPVTCSPRPIQAGGIPIYIGGYAPAAVRRAGRIADGHLAGPATVAMVQTYRSQIAQGAIERGRDPANIKTVISIPPGVKLTRDLTRHYEDAGVAEIVLPVPDVPRDWSQPLSSRWFDKIRTSLQEFRADFMEHE